MRVATPLVRGALLAVVGSLMAACGPGSDDAAVAVAPVEPTPPKEPTSTAPSPPPERAGETPGRAAAISTEAGGSAGGGSERSAVPQQAGTNEDAARDSGSDDGQLTAHQRDDVVEGDPPANLYWGTADPGERVVVSWSLGERRTKADADGEWSLAVTFDDLPEGEHRFDVTVGLAERPTVKTKLPVTVVQTDQRGGNLEAHQKDDVVEGDPPANVYWGYADEGGKVSVTARYGSAFRYTDEVTGEWALDVVFEDAPPGETTFDVTVELDGHPEAMQTFRVTTHRPES